MTIPTFPTFIGIEWPVGRQPLWDTLLQKPISGKETRLQLWTAPRYQYTASFSILGSNGASVSGTTNSDWNTLLGFFNQVGGSALPFHFYDNTDNAVTTQLLGTGDGTTTQFNLVRTLGNFVEPIQDGTQSGFLLYNNGSLVSGSNYTFVTDPQWGFTYAVNFNTAPASGHSITATFNYNWPCRFDDDKLAFSQFMLNYHELKKCTFTTMKVV
jgi:uncharacterized protein (TIGR02217 family)